MLEYDQVSPRPMTSSPFFSSNDARVSASEAIFSYTSPVKAILSEPQRPHSTPTDHKAIQDLWIPPKRVLPFAKPKTTQSRSISQLPPLPKPTSVIRSDSISKPETTSQDKVSTPTAKAVAKKRVAQRKSAAVRQAEVEPEPSNAATQKDIAEIPVLQQPEVQAEEPSPLAAKSAAVCSRPASAPIGLVSKAVAPAKKRPAPARPSSRNKRPKMTDRGTQTIPDIDHTPSHVLAPINKVHDLVENSPSPVSPPETCLQDLVSRISKIQAPRAPKEIWETPGYADVDDEHRQMMLDDFICENLENENFLKLACDMGTSWRTMGFQL